MDSLIYLGLILIACAIGYVATAINRTPRVDKKNNLPIDVNRMNAIHRSGGGYAGAYREILEDTQTGGQYLVVSDTNGLSITPVLDRDGKPLIGK